MRSSVDTSLSPTRPRLDYIDNLRVLACFLVLLTHSAMHPSNASKEGIWLSGIAFIGSPSSELFLALSGTVLLPIKTGFRKFYKRRFIKLLPPLFVWSVLGVILHVYTQHIPWDVALFRIERIPLQQAIGVYWFVYAMIGLYLLAPFISPWLKNASKRQIELFLVIWATNMIFPWILYFYPNFTTVFVIKGDYYWQLCYFGGFLGYWLMGYYLNKYPIKMGWNWKWISLISITIAYPVILAILRGQGKNVDILLDNLQLGSAVLVAFLYTLLQNIRLNRHIQSIISKIAKYSFCIYLTHIYIARDLYWGIFEGSSIHIFPRTFLIAFLTLLTGYALTYILSLIPKSNYFTGV